MNDNDSTDEKTPAAEAWTEIATAHDWMAQANAYAARKEAIFPANRAAIFDAMERHGIDSVLISFDGSGDSGQIESVAAMPETAPTLSSLKLQQKDARWESDAIETVEIDLRAALENLAYDLLEKSHDGWEINEGAYGEFTFDTKSREITLDYNERYESSVYSRRAF
jgi:hypothetical protein